MKIRDIHTKLATRLRLSKRFDESSCTPDLGRMVLSAEQQRSSRLMSLPLEIRKAIYEEVWADAGCVQHILLRDGGYTSMKCITNHATSDDDLMQQCYNHGRDHFEDPVIWRRLMSTWGNHWACEELAQSQTGENRSKGASRSQFLTLMLVCKRMYIECRASIYSNVTFVVHDIETLHSITSRRRLSLMDEVSYLNIAARLPIRRVSKAKMSPEGCATMVVWRECCRALGELKHLKAVDLWLDTCEPSWRAVLCELQDGIVNPYVFNDRLASVLTVDLPMNPEKPEVWQSIAAIEPTFQIRARGWPLFRALERTTTPFSIIKLWPSAEPGAPQPPLVFGTTRCGPRRPRRRAGILGRRVV